MRRLAFIPLAYCSLALAQVSPVQPQGSQIPGPAQGGAGLDWYSEMTNWRRDSAAAFPRWQEALRVWRNEQHIRMGYDDSEYRRPELLWTQRDFVQPQAMVEERYLYDPVQRRYTAGRFLDDLDKRYGGIDSVLLWPVYPNIGIDNRNQFDLLRDMPGGLSALRQMVSEMHQRGVRVLFPNMPWDGGTRAEPSSFAETIAGLMKEIGA